MKPRRSKNKTAAQKAALAAQGLGASKSPAKAAAKSPAVAKSPLQGPAKNARPVKGAEKEPGKYVAGAKRAEKAPGRSVAEGRKPLAPKRGFDDLLADARERPDRRSEPQAPPPEQPPEGDFQRIYGKHPVREALSTDRPVYKLWIAQTLTPAVLREFEKLAKERSVPVQLVPNSKLEALLAHLGPVNHQGIVAETGAFDYADWDQWLTGLKEKGNDAFVVVLDQLQDPHNLGAILRTAEAAGVHGVVITTHGSVGLSETVAKASAGAIETVPVLQVINLARTLEELKKAGLWIMGLSANEGQSHFKANLKGPVALVIGSEHKGLRPNTEAHCDSLLMIPMQSTRSLNASVAAAVVMYEVVRQRQV